VFVGFLSALLATGTPIITPYLNKQIVDLGILQGDIRTVVQTGVILAGFFLLGIVMNYIRLLAFQVESEKIVMRIKADLLESILKKPYSFLVNRATGYLATRIESDVESIRPLFIESVITGMLNVFQILAITCIIWTLNVHLTVICALAVLAMVPLARFAGKKLNAFAKTIQESLARKMALLHECISGVLLVKISNKSGEEKLRFGKVLSDYFRQVFQRDLFQTNVNTWATCLSGLPPVAIVVIGGVFVIQDRLTLGALMAFILYYTQLLRTGNSLINIDFNWQRSFASLERIFEIFDAPDETDSVSSGDIVPSIEKDIRFNDVLFSYNGGQLVLNGVSFTIPVKKKTAIVGESGVGKTTLIMLLLKLLEPKKGDIFLDGVSIRKINVVSIRSMIGYVPQNVFLFNRSLRDNVLYRLQDNRTDDSALVRSLGLLKLSNLTKGSSTGLDTVVGERGMKLSNGEIQRIGILRELLHNPQVLIWDEATSSLDSLSEEIIYTSMEKVIEGKTAIIIAHRLSTVTHADHIVVLKNGSVVGEGSHEDLLRGCEYYRNLFHNQFVS
jgi:ABC-type bacteriocin/lantibiotic exporter with double-glycine peptidase domain